MDNWFIAIVTVCLAMLKPFVHLFFTAQLKAKKKLPPGPPSIPLIGLLRWAGKSAQEIQAILRSLLVKYGPIITIPIGSNPVIMVSSHSLAHQALIQKGAVFANRPEAPLTIKLCTSNQHNVSSAFYGPTWRSLRRNIATFLHPSRLSLYSHVRRRSLHMLIDRLRAESGAQDGVVKVIDHFQHALFSLLAWMCFGSDFDEHQIYQLEEVLYKFMSSNHKFQILDFCPPLTKIFLYRRWKEFFSLSKDAGSALISIIRSQKQEQDKGSFHSGDCPPYLDTILELELDKDGYKRKLTEKESAGLCSEFLAAGGDTTTTALQWIMANIVKYPAIQEKLIQEINSVVGAEEVKEEDLSKMPYLRGVVLEGLRLHPPVHFGLPHAVVDEAELGGYKVPRNATITFNVVEMGRDPAVWKEPMKFKPERFLAEEAIDITGTREITMMPFGAGRRLCPGYGLAIMHLEYFVANLVQKFEWKPVKADEVDLAEQHGFTVMMKHPLQAHISPRLIKS
ncbi:hypothetical protein Droror1_Dr00018538 [Drosera rotundifolia]